MTRLNFQFGGILAALVLVVAALVMPLAVGGCTADGSPAPPESVLPTPEDVAELRAQVEQAEKTKAAVLSDAQQAVAVAQAALAEAKAATTRPAPDGSTISPDIQAKLLEVATASQRALARAETDAMAINAKADQVLGKVTTALKAAETGLTRDEQGQVDGQAVGGVVGTIVGLIPGAQPFAPLAVELVAGVLGIWGLMTHKKRKAAEQKAATNFRQLVEVVDSFEFLYHGEKKPAEDVLKLRAVQSADTQELVDKITKKRLGK